MIRTSIRHWLVKKLLSVDEKYMINRAICDRYENLRRYRIEEKTAKLDDVQDDIDFYMKLSNIFRTKKHDW